MTTSTANTDAYDDYEPPPAADVGTSADWTVPLDNVVDGKLERFHGKFIGMGSSHRDTHINHERDESARPGTSCSGCRWLESRIFRRDDGWYLLYTVGESIVDGEEPRYRGEWFQSPYEVIDSLTTFKPDVDTGRKVSRLSYAARRVLAQAAYNDMDMRDAYEGRVAHL